MDDHRYHLTLTADGRPVMHGWWGSEAPARRKFARWVGEHGKPGARITLADEETSETLASWPDEPYPRGRRQLSTGSRAARTSSAMLRAMTYPARTRMPPAP